MGFHQDSDHQDDDTRRDELEDAAKRLFAASENLIWDNIIPRRLPKPDMLGHLADRQIRQTELVSLGKLIRSDWPDIGSIHVNKHDESFQLTLCTADENIGQKDRLIAYSNFKDWLIDKLPGFASFEVFVQGPTKWDRTRRCTEIFPVVREPEYIDKSGPEIG